MNMKNIFKKRVVKFFVIAFVFLLLGLSMIMAGTVVVRDGKLFVDNDFTVYSNVLYVDSAGGKVGIGKVPGVELDVEGDIQATNDICIEGGNCLSDVCSGDITKVTGTGPLTFSPGCDNGDCSIGINVDGDGVCDTAGAVCTQGHTHLVGDTDILAGAVDGGEDPIGEIQDESITSHDLAPNSTNNSELVDQIIVPGGIRIGSTSVNYEIDDESQGTGSAALYIGDQRITTENIDSDTTYDLGVNVVWDSTKRGDPGNSDNFYIDLHCALGYVRTQCSGTFSGSWGYKGSRPIGTRGCRAYAYTTSPALELTVYTHCSELIPS